MIKNQKRALQNLVLITQLGISMMAPIFVCIFIGYYLDTRFGTKSMLLLMLLGFLAGCRNGWAMIRRMLRMDQDEEERDRDGRRADKEETS